MCSYGNGLGEFRVCVCRDVLRDSGGAVLWPMIGEVGF